MSFTVAGNLAKIEAIVKHCYPGIVVGTIGDQTHAAESGGSDHNPDSRGIVHAVDLMFENDTNFGHGAPTTLAWLLTAGVRGSLEYVIHDRKIYSRNSGQPWIAEVYHGTDPHTNHIHVSGKHGATGKNKATGTGYDVAAEHATPAGSPCATSHPTIPVAPPEDDLSDIMITLPAGYSKAGTQVSLETAISSIMAYTLQARNNAITAANATDPDKLAAAIVAKLPTGSVDVATIKTALAEVLNDATVDLTVPAAG